MMAQAPGKTEYASLRCGIAHSPGLSTILSPLSVALSIVTIDFWCRPATAMAAGSVELATFRRREVVMQPFRVAE
jgi:hypothetical protein